METQRYHLFPMLGLVFLVTPWLRRGFARWARRPEIGMAAGVIVAGLLLLTHDRELKGRARFLRFTDQPAALATLERLDEVCAREGITRPQALAALGPKFADWAPEGRSVLVMLGPCAREARVENARAVAVIAAETARGGAAPVSRK